MGTSYLWAKCWKNTFVDRKAELDNYNNYTVKDKLGNVIRKLEVVKSTMIGSKYFAAIKYDEYTVKAVMCTIKVKGGRVTITRTREDENIKDYSCPLSIIKCLTPTLDVVSNEWRDKCIENHNIKKE